MSCRIIGNLSHVSMGNNMVGVLYVAIFYNVKYSDSFYPNSIIDIIGNIPDIIICTIRGVTISFVPR